MGTGSTSGSSQKSSQASTSTTTSTSYTPEQKEWLGKALSLYGAKLGQGTQSYTGERLAGFTPEQQSAMSNLGGYADVFAANREIPLYGETGTALSKILAGEGGATPTTPEQTEAYYRGTIYNPAQKEFRETTLPGIKESYAGPGYWGSARAQAETKGRQDLADTLGTQRSNLYWQTNLANQALQEAAANRMQQGVTQGISYGQVPTAEATQRLAGLGSVFDFGAAGQAQKQAEIDTAIQKWTETTQITNPEDLAVILSLLGMNYSTSTSVARGTGTSSGTSWGDPWYMQLLT